MSDDFIDPGVVPVDLSRVGSSLATYSVETRQEAIKAIDRITARVARRLVYSAPDLGWQVIEREGAFTVHYMAFEDLIVFLAITTGYKPPFERWEAFCLKRDGINMTIRIDGLEKGPSARAGLLGSQFMPQVGRIRFVRHSHRAFAPGGSKVGLPALLASDRSAGENVTLHAGVVGDDLPLEVSGRSDCVAFHPFYAATGAGFVFQSDQRSAAPMLHHHQQRAAVQANSLAIFFGGDLQASAAANGLTGLLQLEDGRQAWELPAVSECRYAGMLVNVAGCHLYGGLSAPTFAIDRQTARDISASAHVGSAMLLTLGKQHADGIADYNAVADKTKTGRDGTHFATKQVRAVSLLNNTWERALFYLGTNKVEATSYNTASPQANCEDGIEDLVVDRAVRFGPEVTVLRHCGVPPNNLVGPHENSKLLTRLESRGIDHPSSMLCSGGHKSAERAGFLT